MNDVGQRALDRVYSRMMIDAEWSVRSDRSFIWWPKDFAQTVSVSFPVESQGLQVCRLKASTALVHRLSANSRVLEIVDGLNSYYGGGLSALVLDGTGTLSYVSAVIVHEQVLEFASKVFAVTSAMQATDAQIRAPFLAETLGGQAATGCHPSSGSRSECDDTLNVIEQLVVPWGAQPSRWIGEAMLEALELCKGPSLLAIGDEGGLAVEFPWLDLTCLVELDPAFAHHRLGNCLHVTLKLPIKTDREELLGFTHALNMAEARLETLTDFRGGWCISPSEAVTFSAVYPNFLFQSGFATNIALSMGARAEWLVTLFDSRSREQRWHDASPAAFVAMGADGNLSRAGRDPDLINMMAEAEGRPAFGEPGTLTSGEVQQRVEALIHGTLREIAGEGCRLGAAYARLWEGVRTGSDEDRHTASTQLSTLTGLLASD